MSDYEDKDEHEHGHDKPKPGSAQPNDLQQPPPPTIPGEIPGPGDKPPGDDEGEGN